jgi:hypothetical protein
MVFDEGRFAWLSEGYHSPLLRAKDAEVANIDRFLQSC